jgi:hypothetical protein
MESMYEEKLIKCLENIQKSIPAEDLAIQLDIAADIGLIEQVQELGSIWFSPVKEGVAERIVRLSRLVDSSVELGYHFCYGDVNHRHFVEPRDTRVIVELANSIIHELDRQIDWVHLPVPASKYDEAFFKPLEKLSINQCKKIYLDVVHDDGIDATDKRIAAASKVLADFGISAECGFGRTSISEFESIMAVASEHHF